MLSKKILQFCLISIIFFSSFSKITAQSYHNLLSIGNYYASPNYLPAKSTLNVSYIRASLPVKLKSGDYLLLNPDFHKQSLTFNSMEKLDCYKMGLVSAFMKIQTKGSFLVLFNASNNFEKNYMGWNSMQIGTGFLVTRKVNSNFKLKYGLYVNKEFFGPSIVPLIGLDYKIRPNLRLFGVVPQYLKLELKHNKIFRSLLWTETPLNSYWSQSNSINNYIDQRQGLIALSEEIYFNKNIVLQLSFRVPIYNTQRIFNENQTFKAVIWGVGIGGERKENPLEIDSMKHNSIIEFSFNFRLPLEK